MGKKNARKGGPSARKVVLPIYPGPDMPPRQATRREAFEALGESDVAGVQIAGQATELFLSTIFAAEGQPACKAGCAHCCTAHVTVTIPEVIRVVEAAEKLPATELAGVRDRLRANAAMVAGTDWNAYPNVPCAFLANDRCLVYEARPLKCRAAHSLDVEACRAPMLKGIPRSGRADAHAVASHIGFLEALETAGRDASPYELQQAAHLLLEDRKLGSRWRRGEPVFASARSNEKSMADQMAEMAAKLGAMR